MKCTKCKGTGYIKAKGAWVTDYDSDPCPRCHTTGQEPEPRKKQRKKHQKRNHYEAPR